MTFGRGSLSVSTLLMSTLQCHCPPMGCSREPHQSVQVCQEPGQKEPTATWDGYCVWQLLERAGLQKGGAQKQDSSRRFKALATLQKENEVSNSSSKSAS